MLEGMVHLRFNYLPRPYHISLKQRFLPFSLPPHKRRRREKEVTDIIVVADATKLKIQRPLKC